MVSRWINSTKVVEVDSFVLCIFTSVNEFSAHSITHSIFNSLNQVLNLHSFNLSPTQLSTQSIYPSLNNPLNFQSTTELIQSATLLSIPLIYTHSSTHLICSNHSITYTRNLSLNHSFCGVEGEGELEAAA